MQWRRFRTWLREFRWFAVLALITAICGVVVAFSHAGLTQVVAVAALSVTLAILSTLENAP
jgi:hypothetical protein